MILSWLAIGTITFEVALLINSIPIIDFRKDYLRQQYQIRAKSLSSNEGKSRAVGSLEELLLAHQ